MNKFPANPIHGDIYEYKTGLLYQYDAGVNGWIPVVSNGATLELATPSKSGAMSSVDLRKLNRLVLPFPQSTIIGNDCDSPFAIGNISLTSGDNFVSVEGKSKIRNVDQFGDDIQTIEDSHIHQHTFGFDFTLNLPNLIQELIRLNQIKLEGDTGPKGHDGAKGKSGLDFIFSGPAGNKGLSGTSPECNLSIEPEPLSVNPKYGLNKAFVGARIKDHPIDRNKYLLELDRQSVGNDRAAKRVNVERFGSYWVIAVSGRTGPSVSTASSGICGDTLDPITRQKQLVYYLDIEPLINSIRAKFLEQVELLKAGYESITKHWVQTMSDMFDEQKLALCCALENCISKTKSVDARRHMESTAASALPDGRIRVNVFPPSGTPSGDDVRVMSNTRRTPRNDCFGEFVANKSSVNSIIVDASVNVASAKRAKTVDLDGGKYSIVINDISVKIDDQYGSPLRVQYIKNGIKKIATFLDKGRYGILDEAKRAYQGLALSIDHDGGEVSFYFPSFMSSNMSGNVALEISKDSSENDSTLIKMIGTKANDFYCSMTSSHLNWYRKGWQQGMCCGLVLNIAGQDYIIFKRDVDQSGENEHTQCIAAANQHFKMHPSFAWPTLNDTDFTPIPDGNIMFKYDEEMNITAREKISSLDYRNPRGNPNNHRYLAYQLNLILFPTSSNG
jgi:hypothetical protein